MIQTARGTKDLLFEEQLTHKYIIDTSRTYALNSGYSEIELPIFENTDIFHRLGKSSDIVTKETYTFLDRADNSLTLRPEGTAQIARALISNGLTQSLPTRFFNAGPMFRYERPQKGRYRQFTQVSIELLGIETYHGDIEIIQLAELFLQAINVRSKTRLQINSLGDEESRNNYRLKLIDFFAKYKCDLSEDSQRRLQSNPLRILDSKDENDRKIVQSAPLYKDYLNHNSLSLFDNVLNYLTKLKINFEINDKLVRGLDYYCHTAFEYITNDSLSQNAVLSGGRYDGLVQSLGGPNIAGIGWAAGVDRLALLLDKKISRPVPIKLIPLTQDEELLAFEISNKFKTQNIAIEIMYGGNIAKQLKKATKCNAVFAIIMGKQEVNKQSVIVKNLENSTEESVYLDNLIDYFIEHQ